MTRKARSDSKLKQLTPEQQEELWELLTLPQGKKKKPLSLDEAKIEVPLRYGFTTSRTALSEFYAWYAQRLRMENAVARAEQAKLEFLAENPEASPEALARLGQLVFTNEALQEGDGKLFISLMKLGIAQRAQELDERRIRLLEEKASEVKEKLESVLNAAKTKGGLTEETLQRIEEAANLL